MATSLPRGVNSLLLGHDLPESKGEMLPMKLNKEICGDKYILSLHSWFLALKRQWKSFINNCSFSYAVL